MSRLDMSQVQLGIEPGSHRFIVERLYHYATQVFSSIVVKCGFAMAPSLYSAKNSGWILLSLISVLGFDIDLRYLPENLHLIRHLNMRSVTSSSTKICVGYRSLTYATTRAGLQSNPPLARAVCRFTWSLRTSLLDHIKVSPPFGLRFATFD
ncbi:hypothetical protein Bbelb_145540 [Branchiostoma belcheri]|nr:hypothetical protein Bbelb_145540 [Branchiostoma belcheri]